MRLARRAWWRRVLDLVSQAGNVILLNGEPDEPISARVWRAEQEAHWLARHRPNSPSTRWAGRWGWLRRAIDTLFWWEPEHCRQSHELDLRRSLERLSREDLLKEKEGATGTV